ncbi:hypothetical protein LK542_02140 [Massilia sp. IC2-477]|uniref:hypothetical protein n=1 Tax=Massilia sp. IC2-477 TaxID=2887198 RepID=UPI001D103F36|nr:hypothetical protein [Massilia sp. IC2-477]MCC2954410.1 hypothetical protein [Massilia sp. IC2-477]
MRTKLLLAAAATFFTLTATAAPQGAGTERVDVVGAQPRQVQMAPFMFDNVQGLFELEDGRMLTVTGKVDGKTRTLYADFGDGPTEIVHVGKSRFVAVGKDLRFSFERPNSRRLPDTVRITNLAGRYVALAQR